MSNPYASKAPEHFWKSAVGTRATEDVNPIAARRFQLAPNDLIATAGSCFAQHVGKHLKAHGRVRFLETEDIGPNQPSFSALYGNIYTTRQLLQLVEEALGERRPTDIAWRRPDRAYVDALRPTIFANGFPDAASLHEARRRHLAAVRAMLSGCTVFVFTLGLTEAWQSLRDGTVYPLAPGVAASPSNPEDFGFRNLGYEEVLGDLAQSAMRLKAINPGARILLTVSPVPLTATYSEEHVLVATTHSKSILRAACSAMTEKFEHVYYFPSYEIITGNFSRGRYYDENLRTIAPEGVAHVMRVFDQTYGLTEPVAGANAPPRTARPSRLFSDDDADVLCDEAEIVKTLGF
jgi:hypothetical protein